jgi:hypothetical protein
MNAMGKKRSTDVETQRVPRGDQEEEVEEPKLNVVSAIILLVAVTVVRFIVSLCRLDVELTFFVACCVYCGVPC